MEQQSNEYSQREFDHPSLMDHHLFGEEEGGGGGVMITTVVFLIVLIVLLMLFAYIPGTRKIYSWMPGSKRISGDNGKTCIGLEFSTPSSDALKKLLASTADMIVLMKTLVCSKKELIKEMIKTGTTVGAVNGTPPDAEINGCHVMRNNIAQTKSKLKQQLSPATLTDGEKTDIANAFDAWADSVLEAVCGNTKKGIDLDKVQKLMLGIVDAFCED